MTNTFFCEFTEILACLLLSMYFTLTMIEEKICEILHFTMNPFNSLSSGNEYGVDIGKCRDSLGSGDTSTSQHAWGKVAMAMAMADRAAARDQLRRIIAQRSNEKPALALRDFEYRADQTPTAYCRQMLLSGIFKNGLLRWLVSFICSV